jgi:Helix-turn-helix domain
VREAADELGLSWDAALSVLKRCSNKNKRSEEAVVFAAADKIKDPGKHPVLTLPEVMILLRISRSTAYRYAEEGKLKRAQLGKQAGRRGKFCILTESVVSLLKESSE